MKEIALVALLIATFPDGTTTRTPVTTYENCLIASNAYLHGPSLSGLSQTATYAECFVTTPEVAGFLPGWDCIKNYNCERKP